MASQVLIPFPPAVPSITISNLKVSDPADPASTQSIIKVSDPFDVAVDVTFAPASPFLTFLLGLGLSLQVEFAFEGFGAATETTVGPTTTVTNGTDLVYSDIKFSVPPSTLSPGVYKLSALLKVVGGGTTLAVGFLYDNTQVFQVF